MCGLFGYSGALDPDPSCLRLAGQEAARRGPHACGWAYLDGARVQRVVYPRPLAQLLDRLCETRSTTIIGQARLATSGDWRDARDNQPILGNDLAIAHNGVVRHPGALALTHDLALETRCDSEVILRLMAAALRSVPDLSDAALVALQALPADAPLALVAMRGDALLALRRGQPLWVATQGHAQYLSSRPFNGARELPDRTWTLYQRGDALAQEAL